MGLSEIEGRNGKVIRAERGQIPIVLLRIAGVYDGGGHSIPLAHQIQRIYERQITSHVYPGDLTRGQTFIHLDDLIDAIDRVVERRRELGPESTFLLGEPDTLSYGELQREFGRLIHDEDWETKHIAKSLAKTGARMQDAVPGQDPFIKPWMIDLADDHYALDISRDRKALGWEPKRSLRETLSRMVQALKADPKKFYRDNKLGEPPAPATQREHEPAAKESA